MSYAKLFQTAVHSLRQNPLRTVLTLLGVIIGVASVIALVSIGNATTSNVTSQIQGLGTNLLVITPGQSVQGGVSQGLGSASSLTDADVTKLQGLSTLSAVAPDATTRGQVIAGNTNYQTSIEGSTPDLFAIRNLTMSEGRAFNLVEEQNEAHVAVIGETVAENLFGYKDPVGKTVWINGQSFQVIGKLTSQGSSGSLNNDDRIIVPYTTLTHHLTGAANPSVLYASAKDSTKMDQAQVEIESTLRQMHGLHGSDQDDFVITNQSTLLSTLAGVSQALQAFLGGIAGISLLVGGIGIMNIMMVSVTERTREIGLRKALGATRNVILQQFIVESGLVGLIGGLVGIILGLMGTVIAGHLMNSTVSIDISSIWVAFLVSLVVGVVFGIYPAYRAARLSPIEALRYE